MENQQDSTTSQPVTLTLEVVPEDPQNSDPALVDAVGRDTADARRSEGYTVQPVYTGTRGGPLVETIAFLSQTLAAAQPDTWKQRVGISGAKAEVIHETTMRLDVLQLLGALTRAVQSARERRMGVLFWGE